MPDNERNKRDERSDRPEALPLQAWLLPIAEGMTVALGPAELKYLEQIQTPVVVPGLPAYSEQGFIWREQFIPIINLQQLITRRRTPLPQEQLVAIVAYQSGDDEPLQLGALALSDMPRLTEIDPEQAQPLDALAGPWQRLAHAVFTRDNTPCPVLDLAHLFGTEPHQLLTRH